MRKILLIAKRDYLASVRTKGFVIGLFIAPILFGGSFLGMGLMKAKPDTRLKSVAVVDSSGIAPDLIRQLNTISGYRFESVPPDNQNSDAQRLALSDRVRRTQLFAFVEIEAGPPLRASLYSAAAGFNEAQRSIDGALKEAVRRVRLERLGIDPRLLNEALQPLSMTSMSLVAKDHKTGQLIRARRRGMEGFIVPSILGVLLTMIVLVVSGPMLTAVAEDKLQRVFEMLLASATPLDLMAGKIVASVGVAFTSAAFYIVSALALLAGSAMIGLAPIGLLPWFLVYLLAEIIVLSALATALGSACSSPQQSENLKLLVFCPVLIPLFLIVPVLQQPNGPVATVASFIPLFTPLLMLMRQASSEGVPGWQPWVALGGVILSTLAAAWMSSRIFRISLLAQGKTPDLRQLVRWCFMD